MQLKRYEWKSLEQVEKGNKPVTIPVTIHPVPEAKGSTVKAAREALKNGSSQFTQDYILLIAEARAKGMYKEALEALKWLIEHTPADEDGLRIIDESAAKPKPVDQGTNNKPIVQIGIAFSNKPQQAALPPADVIDIPADDKDEQ